MLAAALKETGYAEVEVHDGPQLMHGWNDQTARAEVIVRREHITGPSYGDFGFTRQPDGSFEAVIDAMDLNRNGTQWLTLCPHT